MSPWGEVHDPQVLDERLRAKRYAAITVVHSETSTGARNDIPRSPRSPSAIMSSH